MFRSCRHIVFAIGLIAFFAGSALGQTQEQTENSQGETQQDQRPTEISPIPLPVEIIEDQSETDARHRYEAETRQREIEDLAAQQGMNAATQAMNEATQRMAEYAFWSTLVVAIGTAFVLGTIILMWCANRAAFKAIEVARDIGQRQIRAYVGVIGTKVKMREDGIVESIVRIENTGQTPATNLVAQTTLTVRPHPSDDPFAIADEIQTERSRTVLGGGRSATIQNLMIPAPLSIEYQNDISAKKAAIFVYGIISYDDVFDCPHVSQFRLMYAGKWGGEQSLDACEEGNQAD